jgi:hypothetical protein
MSNWLDIVGSFIVGGIVILILANINQRDQVLQ